MIRIKQIRIISINSYISIDSMAKKILIIEDEEIIIGLLEKKLIQEGYEVSVARDGQEGPPSTPLPIRGRGFSHKRAPWDAIRRPTGCPPHPNNRRGF